MARLGRLELPACGFGGRHTKRQAGRERNEDEKDLYDHVVFAKGHFRSIPNGDVVYDVVNSYQALMKKVIR